jgi:hypothetical protein
MLLVLVLKPPIHPLLVGVLDPTVGRRKEELDVRAELRAEQYGGRPEQGSIRAG